MAGRVAFWAAVSARASSSVIARLSCVSGSPESKNEMNERRNEMSQSIEEKNEALVLEAFETLFNKRDFARAERFWSPKYIQHSAHIPPGREGLFELVKNAPATMRYENQLILANGNLLMLHGRFTGLGERVPN